MAHKLSWFWDMEDSSLCNGNAALSMRLPGMVLHTEREWQQWHVPHEQCQWSLACLPRSVPFGRHWVIYNQQGNLFAHIHKTWHSNHEPVTRRIAGARKTVVPNTDVASHYVLAEWKAMARGEAIDNQARMSSALAETVSVCLAWQQTRGGLNGCWCFTPQTGDQCPINVPALRQARLSYIYHYSSLLDLPISNP